MDIKQARAIAERLRRETRNPDTITVCDAFLELAVQREQASPAKAKGRDPEKRRAYMRNLMAKRRKEKAA